MKYVFKRHVTANDTGLKTTLLSAICQLCSTGENSQQLRLTIPIKGKKREWKNVGSRDGCAHPQISITSRMQGGKMQEKTLVSDLQFNLFTRFIYIASAGTNC